MMRFWSNIWTDTLEKSPNTYSKQEQQWGGECIRLQIRFMITASTRRLAVRATRFANKHIKLSIFHSTTRFIYFYLWRIQFILFYLDPESRPNQMCHGLTWPRNPGMQTHGVTTPRRETKHSADFKTKNHWATKSSPDTTPCAVMWYHIIPTHPVPFHLIPSRTIHHHAFC